MGRNKIFLVKGKKLGGEEEFSFAIPALVQRI